MSLKRSYTLIAPFYDALVRRPLESARRASIARLPADRPARILISGIGTGLDLPCLPSIHEYHGLDLNAAMIGRARARPERLRLCLVQGDSQRLPYRDECFDFALLHLIVAVVPDGAAVLRETARVLRPSGIVFLLDKFLLPGAFAPLRRAINPLIRQVATRTDVVFADIAAEVPQLRLLDDEPALLRGWFRLIRMQKAGR